MWHDRVVRWLVARAWLRHLPAETSYEATYILSLHRRLSLQPDLQYVTRPGGRYPGALVVILRLNFALRSHGPP